MGFQDAFVFLVLLYAAVMVHGQPGNVRPRYIHFLNQHVHNGMTKQKCTGYIGYLKLTEPNSNRCKEINTFIATDGNRVNDICRQAGRRLENNRDLYESNKPFPVVTCKLTSGMFHDKCEYRGSESTRRVVIACDQGWPVHYDGDNVVVNGRK
ncbi:ribonuclease-like 3 [Esox lucius]|uniref:Ribonuclease A-domain domain-containing protein n=1 Tax=Esox lucius TaxID=8010 RepID=A0AAY5KMG3_ESOLU|nr:ribonuclease-like 3 [Esox lucius]